MAQYEMFNDDRHVATFTFDGGRITTYATLVPELLPMQIRATTADGFTSWIRERSIDLNTLQHRNLANELLGSRDKVTLALKTNMFSISDKFTCFEAGTFTPRTQLCNPDDQNAISSFILLSSETSLRNAHVSTPNISTDGSFPKTWVYEEGAWWLYKIQSAAATKAEIEISEVLRSMGWDAAIYLPVPSSDSRVRSLNFVGDGEFFEPYDSLRFMFDDASDDESTIRKNIQSLGSDFGRDWKRISVADAFFENTDRHMRNFGVIRSTQTGAILRMAPNYDNNQAYQANPNGKYTGGMLKLFLKSADHADLQALKVLIDATRENQYFAEAFVLGDALLKSL